MHLTLLVPELAALILDLETLMMGYLREMVSVIMCQHSSRWMGQWEKLS